MTDPADPDPAARPRCGFVALVGAPNAGKSTLLNQMVGAKVTIVSPKAQTTRSRVLGILTQDGSQVVLVDTPGIFQPKRRLDRAMVRAAWQGAEDADLICLVVDAGRKRASEETLVICRKLAQADRRAILVLNKTDLADKAALLALTAELNDHVPFTDTFMVSALSGDGVADLVGHLAARVPDGVWLYPEDQLSDLPMRLLAAEIVREKLFHRLYQELPYALSVEPEQWQEREDGSAEVHCVIYVQRDSQKAIIIGKGGQMLKAIGTAARLELEEMLERRLHLALFVKVRDRWLDDPERYSAWGLDFNA